MVKKEKEDQIQTQNNKKRKDSIRQEMNNEIQKETQFSQEISLNQSFCSNEENQFFDKNEKNEDQDLNKDLEQNQLNDEKKDIKFTYLNDFLPTPNDIIKKDKYQKDNTQIKHKIVQNNSNLNQKTINEDEKIWKQKSAQLAAQQMMQSSGLNIDHYCKPTNIEKNDFHCIICQKVLKILFYSGLKMQEPFQIYYNNFSQLLEQEKIQPQQNIIQNYTDKIENLMILREFSYVIMNRQPGVGFRQIYTENNLELQKYFKLCRISNDKIQQNKPLKFFGDYEAANLSKVFWVNDYEVKIILKSDTNSKGFTQWFNFGVQYQGTSDNQLIKFIIINNRKEYSNYSHGMQVAIGQQNENGDFEWSKGGQQISYYKNTKKQQIQTVNDQEINFQQLGVQKIIESSNNTQQENNNDKQIQNISDGVQTAGGNNINNNNSDKKKKKDSSSFYSLEFQYNFVKESSKNPILFAYSEPYTFTNLIDLIQSIESKIYQIPNTDYENDPSTKTVCFKNGKLFYKKEIIGGSRLGLPIYKIELTAPKSKKYKFQIPYEQRKQVVIIARQHPGETPGSFVCEGLLKFLTNSDNLTQQTLLQFFIFHIIPMVNPDGVVCGNNRCNISGFDINRRWEKPDTVLDREVYQIKSCLNKLIKNEIYFFLDLHGHSNKSGCFLFGTEQSSKNYNTISWTSERLFFKVMQHLSSPYFDISKCTYDMNQQTTARYVMCKKLKAQFSFTLETSFYGYQQKQIDGKNQIIQFQKTDYDKIGASLAQSILVFSLVREQMKQEALKNGGELPLPKNKQKPEFEHVLGPWQIEEDVESITNSDNKYSESQNQRNQENLNQHMNINTMGSSVNSEDLCQKKIIKVQKFLEVNNTNPNFLNITPQKQQQQQQQQQQQSQKQQNIQNQSSEKQKSEKKKQQIQLNEDIYLGRFLVRQNKQVQKKVQSLEHAQKKSDQNKIKQFTVLMIEQKSQIQEIVGYGSRTLNWNSFFNNEELTNSFKYLYKHIKPPNFYKEESDLESNSEPEDDMIPANIEFEQFQLQQQQQEGNNKINAKQLQFQEITSQKTKERVKNQFNYLKQLKIGKQNNNFTHNIDTNNSTQNSKTNLKEEEINLNLNGIKIDKKFNGQDQSGKSTSQLPMFSDFQKVIHQGQYKINKLFQNIKKIEKDKINRQFVTLQFVSNNGEKNTRYQTEQDIPNLIEGQSFQNNNMNMNNSFQLKQFQQQHKSLKNLKQVSVYEKGYSNNKSSSNLNLVTNNINKNYNNNILNNNNNNGIIQITNPFVLPYKEVRNLVPINQKIFKNNYKIEGKTQLKDELIGKDYIKNQEFYQNSARDYYDQQQSQDAYPINMSTQNLNHLYKNAQEEYAIFKKLLADEDKQSSAFHAQTTIQNFKQRLNKKLFQKQHKSIYNSQNMILQKNIQMNNNFNINLNLNEDQNNFMSYRKIYEVNKLQQNQNFAQLQQQEQNSTTQNQFQPHQQQLLKEDQGLLYKQQIQSIIRNTKSSHSFKNGLNDEEDYQTFEQSIQNQQQNLKQQRSSSFKIRNNSLQQNYKINQITNNVKLDLIAQSFQDVEQLN